MKNLPYNLLITLLTGGASLSLGFLSFSGMYALTPILPLAFAAFGLSVAYEAEIYLQNIKGAVAKLLKITYLDVSFRQKVYAGNPINFKDKDCPQFFYRL